MDKRTNFQNCREEKNDCLKEVLQGKLATTLRERGTRPKFNTEKRAEVKDAMQACLDAFKECRYNLRNDEINARPPEPMTPESFENDDIDTEDSVQK